MSILRSDATATEFAIRLLGSDWVLIGNAPRLPKYPETGYYEEDGRDGSYFYRFSNGDVIYLSVKNELIADYHCDTVMNHESAGAVTNATFKNEVLMLLQGKACAKEAERFKSLWLELMKSGECPLGTVIEYGLKSRSIPAIWCTDVALSVSHHFGDGFSSPSLKRVLVEFDTIYANATLNKETILSILSYTGE